MKLNTNTVLGIICRIRQEIDYGTVGLFRLEGSESSRDMFFFKVTQYLESESSKSLPDNQLKYFDFVGYIRDWISPPKQYKVDAEGQIELCDIVKRAFTYLNLPKHCSKALAKSIEKCSDADTAQNGLETAKDFFAAIQTKHFQEEDKSVFIEFIRFGRAISLHPNNRMDAVQTAKMMAPCLLAPIFQPTIISVDRLRLFNSIYQGMLEYCLSLDEADFELLVSGNLFLKPKKGRSFPTLPWKSSTSSSASCSITVQSNARTSNHIVPVTRQDESCLDAELLEIDDSIYTVADGSSIGNSSMQTSSCTELVFQFHSMQLSERDSSYLAQIIKLIHNGNVDELRKSFSNLSDPTGYIRSAKHIFNRSLLHIAVLVQQPQVVKILKEYGAEIIVFDKHRQTPLHYAARWAKYGKSFCSETLTALFEYDSAFVSSKTVKNRDGKSALQLADELGVLALFEQYRKPLPERSQPGF